MTPQIVDCVQRSPEWFRARAGLLCASDAGAVIKVRQRGTGELKERATLRRRLVAERLAGCAAEDNPFQSYDMRHGEETEAAAFAAYEADTGTIVQRVGFVRHETLMAGCSPDGLIGTWGGLELKCPKITTHLDYVQGKVVPEEYRGQILHSLLVTGCEWWDFVSFDDRYTAPLDFFRVRTYRRDLDMTAYELAVTLFLGEVDKEVLETAAALFPQEAAAS